MQEVSGSQAPGPKLNKRVLALIVGGVVLLVLVVAVVLLLNFPQPTGESQESGASVALSSHTPEDVVSVEVNAAYSSYKIERDESGQPYIKALAGYPRNDSALAAMMVDASSVTATRLVAKETATPENYGLAAPLAEVAITYKDGTTLSLKVGDTAPEDLGMYVQSGDGAVYVMPQENLLNFIAPDTEFVSRRLTPALESVSDVAASFKSAGLTRITIGGTRRETPIDIAFDKETGSFTMVSPVRRELDETGVEQLSSLFGLFASRVTTLSPDETAVRDAGLGEPETLITFTYEDKTLEMRLDGSENQYLSAMRSDVDILYALEAQSIDFMLMQYSDLLSDQYVKVLEAQIASITVEDNGKTHTLIPGEHSTFDGKEVGDVNASLFAKLVTSARSEGVNEKAVSGEPDMTITLRYKEGRTEDVFRFFYDGVRSYAVEFNGTADTYLKSSYVDRVREGLLSLASGKEVSLSW